MYCRSGENKISYLDLVAYAEETGKLYFYCFLQFSPFVLYPYSVDHYLRDFTCNT